MTMQPVSIPLPDGATAVSSAVQLFAATLDHLFDQEDGRVVMVSMDRLTERIKRDRGSLSSLIADFDALSLVYRDIDEGKPILMPVLNSRRRDVSRQLVVDSGRHQLYALRNRGIASLAVVVPAGLVEQFEAELGLH